MPLPLLRNNPRGLDPKRVEKHLRSSNRIAQQTACAGFPATPAAIVEHPRQTAPRRLAAVDPVPESNDSHALLLSNASRVFPAPGRPKAAFPDSACHLIREP